MVILIPQFKITLQKEQRCGVQMCSAFGGTIDGPLYLRHPSAEWKLGRPVRGMLSAKDGSPELGHMAGHKRKAHTKAPEGT